MAAIGLCFTVSQLLLYTVVGFIMVVWQGPVLTGWFKVLDKTLGKTVSGRGMCVPVCGHSLLIMLLYFTHRCIEENGC